MADKKSIVAVDDSRIVLQSLEGILSGSYEFRGFTKAERALAYVGMYPPSLIILDIDMPEMNGYELLEKIMEKQELRGTPSIFLTSNNLKDNVIKAAAYGADDYVLKPVDREVLIGKIEALLQK